jgi:hypothetical protein
MRRAVRMLRKPKQPTHPRCVSGGLNVIRLANWVVLCLALGVAGFVISAVEALSR